VNKGGSLEVNLGERILFEGKGDKVSPKSRRLLDGMGRLFTENPQTRVQILAHTDDQGDAGYNLRLSQRQADAVRTYLIERGVGAIRITATGRGEAAPLVATGKRTPTREERAKNRRIELVIEPDPGPDTTTAASDTPTLPLAPKP
jgi:outer membrane protein OmpA-like peptidoglycan-associated protein